MPLNVRNTGTQYHSLRTDHSPSNGQSSIFGSVMDCARSLKTGSPWSPRLPASASIAMTLAALLLCFIAGGSILVGSSQIPLSELKISHAFQQSWGSYAPYYPAGRYEAPGDGCVVDQVNIIQRHGARYPTGGPFVAMNIALQKLQAVHKYKARQLDFLKDYAFDLGKSQLVEFGALQSWQSGEEAYKRYKALVKYTDIPFVRASGSPRVVNSATNWTAGFAAASDGQFRPALDLVIPQDANNTLSNKMCPNIGDDRPQQQQWLELSTHDIIARLEKQAPGATFNHDDVFALMSLCPFETVARGEPANPSPFCSIFTEEEFSRVYSYACDLEKFYGNAYGRELGPVQGVGYINELIARLTGKPVSDHTQTNSTLDSSPETFPFDRSMYIDFSHDNLMIAVYSAMGLFKQPQPLDPTKPDPSHTWIAAKLVPFSGRMVTEKIDCHGSPYVRILVNDAVQPLEFCGADEDGMCALDDFVRSQAYARNGGEGDFEKCFV